MARLAFIHYFDEGPVDPAFGIPGYGGGHPDNSLPGLPPGAVQLPVFPFDPTRPDNSLPPAGHVDNGLPVPGKRYVVKYLACKGLILVPDNSLPGGGTIDNTLPETPEPK